MKLMTLFIPAVAGLLALSTGEVSADRTVQIGYQNMKRFAAANITVAPGETVSWVLASGTHTVVQSRGVRQCAPAPNGFRTPKPLSVPGERWNHTFTRPGTYWYVSDAANDCQEKMWGVVHVRVGATPPPSPATSPQQPDRSSANPGNTNGNPDKSGISANNDKTMMEELPSGAVSTTGLSGSLLGVLTSGVLAAGAVLLL